MAADGSLDLANLDVTLIMEAMPLGPMVRFLASRTVGTPQPFVGSQGSLCLSGNAGRFNLVVEIRNP